MFVSDELKNHLATSDTIEVEAKVYAEWNLNEPDNIARLGNYRYRPTASVLTYRTLPLNYDSTDAGNFYTGATDADIAVDGGWNSTTDEPTVFVDAKTKFNMLYSLEDCVKPFRPRSGINKHVYLGSGQYFNNYGPDIATRPRYYLSSRYDQFKYWTSYRTEYGMDDNGAGPVLTERGVSQYNQSRNVNVIDDAVPFVVYKKSVPANRVVVKMQTNVGTTDIGQIRVGDTLIPDPLYGYTNQTTPVKWRIQVLKDGSWKDAKSFSEVSVRSDGSPIIGPDGYVEIAYGLKIPEQYKDIFTYAGVINNTYPTGLPSSAAEGDAFLFKPSPEQKGSFYIWHDASWQSFEPVYEWDIAESFVSKNSNFLLDPTNPDYFVDGGEKHYREFEFIDGIRIAVETMNKADCMFDLIELSPRLALDVTDRAQDFTVTRLLSDLGNNSLPVGSLLASTGQININNSDAAFTEQNIFNKATSQGSLLADTVTSNVKFSFYEIVKNVGLYDYYVPIKTLYSEGFPQSTQSFDQLGMSLRDAYFILESAPAPSILLQDVSLSSAVVILLDYIGFSNYVFKRAPGVADPVIPYFFVAPEQNVAVVLAQLAVATQSAMFFDEYNNFVVMTKEYLLPEDTSRPTDIVALGQNGNGGELPNIIGISSQNKKVYNSGQINYTQRYIQRNYGILKSSMNTDDAKNWVYSPTLLWEVTGSQNTIAQNTAAAEQSTYALTAMPLNSNISADLPTVSNGAIINNVLDVGESIYYIARYKGYLYANSEILRYDAVEYSVTGLGGTLIPIWIASTQDYQNYFLNLPFNGKMYPTGRIRIYAEPEYETLAGVTTIRNGAVAKHGRGQFGTPVVAHGAGIDEYWVNPANVYGIEQQADYLFTTSPVINYPLGMAQGAVAGKTTQATETAKSSGRNGVIRNWLSQTYWTEAEIKAMRSTQTGTVQSSALVFSGSNFTSGLEPKNYVSYINKALDKPYKHFGTRMRVIGKIEQGTGKPQMPIGGSQYITIPATSTDTAINISGGSGGIGIMTNPVTNNGYFFEIAALTVDNVAKYVDPDAHQIVSFLIPIGGAVVSGSQVTITTQTNHGFYDGDVVTVEGFDNGVINGDWTVLARTDRTLTYSVGVSAGVNPITGGVVRVFVPAEMRVSNVYFYKVIAGPNGEAIPVKMWSGLSNIIVDSGKFAGQYRTMGEENTTIYDLAVEYKDLGSQRIFYLYINDRQVATVFDDNPLTNYNNMSIFVRGSAQCMFENVYALSENFSQNSISVVADSLPQAFGDSQIDAAESIRKYAMSGFIQASYLNSISSFQPPQYHMYFDEFGTIMRECAYFNVKYDKAYPALYAKPSPLLNRLKTYSVSGFYAGAYGADFLVFNCVDKFIQLDSTTGSQLTILGITFTQDTTRSLTVDDYFNKVSSLSNPIIDSGQLLYDPLYNKELYDQIKVSRMRHGKTEFSLDSLYIQSDDAADDIMGWVIKRTMKPKLNIGLNVFGMQNLQLGDIVQVDYLNTDGIYVVTDPDTRFVVYNMEYRRSSSELGHTIYLAEV